MKELASSFESALLLRDGVGIYYSLRIPEDMKALIVISHGVCEHSGRYNFLTDRLNEAGYGVVRYDLRGHGKSGGDRGFVNTFHDFAQDLNELVKHVSKDYPDAPVFMLGHSMGALISALYALSFPETINGQVLSGIPAIELPLGSIRLLRKLPYERFPKLRAKNDLGKLVSRDEAVVSDYENDPLNLKKQTIKMAAEMFLKAPIYVEEHVWEYDLPCLLLHGGDDKIVTPAASKWFADKIMSEDKTRKVYPDLYHEIFNEKEKDQVIKDVIDWLDDRYMNLFPWNKCFVGDIPEEME